VAQSVSMRHVLASRLAWPLCDVDDMLPNSFMPIAVRAVTADVIVVPVTDFTKDGLG